MKSFGSEWTKLKGELSRLTDIKTLKEELSRVAAEVRKLNANLHARERLETLHARLRDARGRLVVLQDRLDRTLDNLMVLIRSKGAGAKSQRKSARRGSSATSKKKAGIRKASGTKKKASKRS